MGVNGLWDLLSPVGRRVSVETLAGKRLAIDASIWMVQFMKAMRDERGEMVRNAHILGFFRRICKLLFLRTKPVFVFDGATPALKRRTVIARRRQRENAQAKIRKTAEKLLLNHIKAMRLKELANELEKQRKSNNADKGKGVITEEMTDVVRNAEKTSSDTKDFDQVALDAMLAASIEAEEGGGFIGEASTSGVEILAEGEDEDDSDDDEEMLLPTLQGKVDPAVLASLPPSMQLDLLVQMRERLMAENRQKYQKVKKAPARFSEMQIEAYLKTVAFRREINEVQKAAGGRGVAGVQTSRIASEANREFIFSSSFTGNRQFLASAGVETNSNVQSQIATKADKGVMSANKSNSAIEAFMNEPRKAFNEDVETYRDERGRVRVNKMKAMGIRMTRDLQRNLDLMKEMEQDKIEPSSKLSDWISHGKATAFSSKFPESSKETGQESVPVGGTLIEVSFDDDNEHQYVDSDDDVFANIVSDPLLTEKQATITLSDCEWEEGMPGETKRERPFPIHSASDDSEVEWEEGPSDDHVLSSARAVEHVEAVSKGEVMEEADLQEAIRRSMEDIDASFEPDKFKDDTNMYIETSSASRLFSESVLSNKSYVDVDEAKIKDAGKPPNAQLEATTSKDLSSMEVQMETSYQSDKKYHHQHSMKAASDRRNSKGETGDVDMINPTITLADCEREEGIPGERKGEIPFAGHSTSDESEVEWEEGPSDNPELSSTREVEHMEVVSKGVLMEDADFQEAIRLSMDDLSRQKDKDISLEPQEFKGDKNMDIETSSASRLSLESVLPNNSSVDVDEAKINETKNDRNSMELLMETSFPSDQKYHHELSMEAASDDRNSQGETGHVDMVIPAKEREVDLNNVTLITSNNLSCTATHNSKSPDVGMRNVTLDDSKQHEDKVTERVLEMLESNGTVKVSKSDFDVVQKVSDERGSNSTFDRKKDDVSKSVFNDMSEEQVEITKAGLKEEMTNLSKERTDLDDEQRRLERNAESVSGEMFAECQELLQMFGLPYIIAPMEAEAQCAFMELENLVDGVVTDDSDVLLFGATSVYKNIFDDRKYVETYFMKDIESELGLTREKLIRMAMLLGSDYTEGISGIGIVNAVEVLNAFPEEDGLHKFREWVESPDPSILGKVGAKEGSIMRTKGSNTSAEEASTLDDDMHRVKQIFMEKHRNVSKNWHIPSTFPSDAVVSAYASPQVDKSTEPFSWGKPDLFVLRKLCAEKFGWGIQKADELLQPVLKEYNKHETQLRLEAFYTFNERFAKIRSKRISKAVKGIAGSKTSELLDHDEVHPSSGKKRKEIKRRDGKDESTAIEKAESSIQEVHQKNTKKGSSVRGRGRGRGRGGGRSVGNRKRKKNYDLELCSTSSDDGNNSNDVPEVHAEHTQGVRKSKRFRKSVISTNCEDSEDSEPTQEDHSEVAGSEEAVKQEETLVTSVAMGVGVNIDHELPLSGNGIHPVEAELDHDWCQNDQDGPQAELSSEYLKMGGGFCLDEGEKEPGLSGCSPSTEAAAREGEVEASISPDGSTDLAVTGLQRNNEMDNDGIRPVSFLSAMPNLKRKRKKV